VPRTPPAPTTALIVRTCRVVAKACGVHSDGHFVHLEVLQQRVALAAATAVVKV